MKVNGWYLCYDFVNSTPFSEWRVGSDRLQSGGADPGGITQEKSPNFKGEVPPTKYWRVEDPQSWEYEYNTYIYIIRIYMVPPPRDLPLAYIIMSIYICILIHYIPLFLTTRHNVVLNLVFISSFFNHVQPLEINNGLIVRLIGGLVWWLFEILRYPNVTQIQK